MVVARDVGAAQGAEGDERGQQGDADRDGRRALHAEVEREVRGVEQTLRALVAETGGLPGTSSSSGRAGFSTSTEPWTIAWVIRYPSSGERAERA